MGVINFIGRKLQQGLNYLGRKVGNGLNYIVSKSDIIKSALENPLVQQLAKQVPYGENIISGAGKALEIAKKGQQAMNLVNQFIPKPVEPIEKKGELEKQVIATPQTNYDPEIEDLD